MKIISKRKFESLIANQIIKNYEIISVLFDRENGKNELEKLSLDEDFVSEFLFGNIETFLVRVVNDIYNELKEHANLFSRLSFQTEIKDVAKIIEEEFVDVFNKNLVKYSYSNYSKNQKLGYTDDDIKSTLLFSRYVVKTLAISHELDLETTLLSHFRGTSYKSLTYEKGSLFISFLALIIACLALLKS